MGLFSKPTPPPVPQASTIVAGQTAASQAAAEGTQKLNSTNQVGPTSSLSYTFDPTTGQYTATNQYSPQQQALLNYLQSTQGQAGAQASQLMTGAGYGGQPDISGNAGSETEKLIAQQMQQLRPEQDYQTSNLDTKLRNQGLVPGDAGYDNQMREFQANLANNNAANAAGFENQAFGQALTNYQLPAQMAESLAGFGSPQSAVANLWNTPQTQVQTPDVNAAYGTMTQAQQAQYKAQMDQYSGLLSGIGKGALAVGAAPFTGGASLAMMPGIFGSSSSSPGTALNGGFTTTTSTPNMFQSMFG